MYTNTKTKKKELLLYWSEQREGRRKEEGDKILIAKFSRVSLCVKGGKRRMYEGSRCMFHLKSEEEMNE